MYYIEQYFNTWIIKKYYDDMFMFGPFNSEGDASFICEMLNNDKLYIKDGNDNGEKGFKDTNSVHFYID